MFVSPDTRIDELISKSVSFQDGQEREFTGIHHDLDIKQYTTGFGTGRIYYKISKWQ